MKLYWPRLTFLTLAAVLAVTCIPLDAKAEGWWNRLKDVYHMPDTVDRMQEQLDETIEQAEAAAQKFEETEQRLMRENEALRQSNAALEARLQAAEALEADRAANTARWTRVAVTGVSLLVLYFLLARMLRWWVWRKAGPANTGFEGKP